MNNIEPTNLAKIEGLLFISGDEGITLGDLSKITGFMKPAILGLLQRLKTRYENDPNSALVLLNSGDTYRLATKHELSPVIKHYFEVPLTIPLTRALLEVLAIVAYRQPITRLEIDDIRGVQSSGSLQKLMVRGLLDTHGRLDAPGRPFLYVTTDSFLDYFGLSSLKELPPLAKQEDLDLDDMNGDLFLEALQARQKQQEEEMERLQKVMAEAGVASRRASEKLIANGHVQVNGKTVTEMGIKVGDHDEVVVDGVPLHREAHVYYLLNKPRAVITSAHDDKGRRTVVDILKEEGVEERVYPVGRLDYDTTGILLLTNDGELANRLMHPKFEVEKTYIAKVRGIINNNDLKQLRIGVEVNGRLTKKAKSRLIETDHKKQTSLVKLTIHEGRYHQVKLMFDAIHHPVIKLHRETYGPLDLHGLQSGEFRELKQDEVKLLKKISK